MTLTGNISHEGMRAGCGPQTRQAFLEGVLHQPKTVFLVPLDSQFF